jgi:hypothetical protein
MSSMSHYECILGVYQLVRRLNVGRRLFLEALIGDTTTLAATRLGLGRAAYRVDVQLVCA